MQNFRRIHSFKRMFWAKIDLSWSSSLAELADIVIDPLLSGAPITSQRKEVVFMSHSLLRSTLFSFISSYFTWNLGRWHPRRTFRWMLYKQTCKIHFVNINPCCDILAINSHCIDQVCPDYSGFSTRRVEKLQNFLIIFVLNDIYWAMKLLSFQWLKILTCCPGIMIW